MGIIIEIRIILVYIVKTNSTVTLKSAIINGSVNCKAWRHWNRHAKAMDLLTVHTQLPSSSC